MLPVPSRFVLEFGDAISGISRVLRSCSEINWLINGFSCKRPPAIDLTHVDLTKGEQRQNNIAAVSADGNTVCVLNPALELFVQT